jgi:hypothetical protein
MAICQIMISDFMHRTGRFTYDEDGNKYEMYDERDLKIGLQYAQDLLYYRGLEKEPFHGYDLREFKRWCKVQLKQLKRGRWRNHV